MIYISHRGNINGPNPQMENDPRYIENTLGKGYNVEVDVFKVSNASFKSIDRLEGHPKWYRRKEIPIKLKSGKELTCWLYFNPQEVTEHTEMHESYRQDYRLKYGLPSSYTYTKIEPTCTQYNMWDGPLDTEGFPMGKGSSSGANGMEIKKYPTEYKAGPITQRAKQ